MTMVALLCFLFALFASPFRSKIRLEAEYVTRQRGRSPPEVGLTTNSVCAENRSLSAMHLMASGLSLASKVAQSNVAIRIDASTEV